MRCECARADGVYLTQSMEARGTAIVLCKRIKKRNLGECCRTSVHGRRPFGFCYLILEKQEFPGQICYSEGITLYNSVEVSCSHRDKRGSQSCPILPINFL
ncbi:hypothetical protein GQ457_11G013080 [Hibiscus cannabinus]